jgi:hypothetical protein
VTIFGLQVFDSRINSVGASSSKLTPATRRACFELNLLDIQTPTNVEVMLATPTIPATGRSATLFFV